MAESEEDKPQWKEVTAEVRFLYRIREDDGQLILNMTLEDLASNITKCNDDREFLGAWGITEARDVGASEAEKIRIELGNDGRLPKR